MIYKTPPFDERFFLLTLLHDYELNRGQEIRYLDTHKFDILATGRLATWFPDLIETFKDEGVSEKYGTLKINHAYPHADEWFQEGLVRGFVQRHEVEIFYLFTKKGYEKALEYQRPGKTFFTDNWQWILTTVIASAGTIAAIIAATAAILQYLK